MNVKIIQLGFETTGGYSHSEHGSNLLIPGLVNPYLEGRTRLRQSMLPRGGQKYWHPPRL